MIQERDYQIAAAEAGVRSLEEKDRQIIVGPTGSGKSIIIAGICRRLDKPTLILQPSKEILEQNYQKLAGYGITDIAMYSASVGQKDIAKFTYATIGSIYKNPQLFQQFKYILVDECHLIDPKSFDEKKLGMYARFFKALHEPKVLGLTASPYRLVSTFRREETKMYSHTSLQVLNRIYPFFFRSFCFSISNQYLFDKGYLCPIDYRTKAEYIIDVDRLQLNTNSSDFSQRALNEYMGSHQNVAKVVDAVVANHKDYRKNLIFCSTIDHADKCCKLLKKFGFQAAVISSLDGAVRRRELINAFRSGKLTHLLNVDILSVGFDDPTLDCITAARPTISLALYYQQLGRGIRPDPSNPDKRCIYLDLVGNVRRMGRIETIKVAKEQGGFRNVVVTEKGVLSGKPLDQFLVRDELNQ